MLKNITIVSLWFLFTFANVSGTAEFSKCTVYPNDGQYDVTFTNTFPVDSLINPNPSYLVDLHFTIDVSSQMYILLSPDPITDPVSEDAYIIGLGVDSSSNCEIKKGDKSQLFETPDLYNIPLDLQSFWIRVHIDGYVEVGKEGDQAFLTWQDPSPTDIKYFSATSKPAGVFKFYYNCEDSTLPSYSSTVLSDCSRCDSGLGSCGYYNIENVPGSDPDYLVDLHFIPRVNADAFAYLLDENYNKIYDIELGWAENTNCEIIKNEIMVQNVECHGILSVIEPNAFWIRMSNDGRIDVGREVDNNAFLSWQDPDPTPVKYFTFNTYLDKRGTVFYSCSKTNLN